MRVRFTLKGVTPLLMHADDVEQADAVSAWREHPDNRNTPKGDDRAPPWTWKTYLYTDGTSIVIPFENLMACLRDAGTKMSKPKGGGRGSLKGETQSGLCTVEDFFPLLLRGKPVKSKAIDAIKGNFAEHAKAAGKLGFRLYVKRARVGDKKHVRVRPRFDVWSMEGTLEVTDPMWTLAMLRTLFDIAGKLGLCDWRAGAKSPGRFGRFKATLKVVA